MNGLIARRGMMAKRGGGRLPAGYTELDSISVKDDAEHQIDTGINIDDTTYGFRVKCAFDGGVYWIFAGICNGRIDSEAKGLCIAGAANMGTMRVMGSRYLNGLAHNGVTVAELNYKNSNKLIINDSVESESITSAALNLNFYLFGINGWTTTHISRQHNFSELEITHGDNVVRHYIACQRNSDSQKGVYELYTAQFIPYI